MAEIYVAWSHLITVLVMAAALGLDAFSLGLGIGTRGIRLLHVAYISATVALFHMIMPLLGLFAGRYVGLLLGDVAVSAGGALLVLLGAHMIYSALFRKQSDATGAQVRSFWGLMLFAVTVSIDSFSVGISLGLFSAHLLLAVAAFGLFGGGMSVAGLLLGRRVGQWLGEYGEAFGGVILLAFGIKFML